MYLLLIYSYNVNLQLDAILVDKYLTALNCNDKKKYYQH